MRKLLAVAVLLAMAGACSDDGGSAEGPPPTLEPVTTTDPAFAGIPAGDDVIGDPAAQIVLIDPGAEPRRALRLDPEVGATQSVTVVMEQGLSVELGGVVEAIPATTTEMDITYTVDAVSETIAYVVRYDDIRVAEGTDPAVAAELEGLFAELIGAEAEIVVDRRGVVLDDSSLGQSLPSVVDAELMDQLSAVSPPLPEEPVGLGARWEAASSISSSGLTMQVTIGFEIVELTDASVVTATQLRMTLPPGLQSFAGQSVEVVGGEMAGEGATTWTFDLPVPIGSQEASGEFTMAANRGGQRMEMTISQRQRTETSLR